MSPDFIDVQCFAGGLTLGAVQAGFRLVGKREQRGGFGMPNCEANRPLLGYQWDAQACDPMEWQPYKVDAIFSNPPCSAFSLLTSRSARGMQSNINSCMYATMEFASRCDPEVIVMESVQAAFTEGRPLMQALRADVEARTGKQYTITHVKHNNVMLGGASERRRYFLVLSRVPFGVETVPITKLTTLEDAIKDLLPSQLTWDAQPYRAPETWWSRTRRRVDGLVDGHAIARETSGQRLSLSLFEAGAEWNQGENHTTTLRRYYERTGTVPPPWEPKLERLLTKEPPFEMGFSQPCRWKWDRPARVITGGGMEQLHPVAPRPFTHREVARILGFPDDWLIHPLRGEKGLSPTWGKGVSVDCGRWIGQWAKAALEGTPGSDTGQAIGDREYLVDHTNAHKHLRKPRERV